MYYIAWKSYNPRILPFFAFREVRIQLSDFSMAQKKSSIGIDSVSLVSLFVESVLYGTRNWSRRSFLAFSHLTGLFIVLFIASTVILLGKTRRLGNKLNKPLLTASFTMFILATIVSAIFSYSFWFE